MKMGNIIEGNKNLSLDILHKINAYWPQPATFP
jgi:hypothetical protein